ncbi:MAG: NAD-dependent epimerase/dehydratase family protein, partial [Chloroflexi bacterium]|nr:NAD-dependent epimerase/dehydratase family protein [Chloroflexota bacterium]
PGNLGEWDVELCEGDLTDRDSLARAVDGCNAVYHLAAVYANWLPDPRVFYRVNVDGTRNLLQACLDHGGPRVVYTSSVAALGAHGKTPANESAQFNLAHTFDHYYMSKYQAEQVALEFAGKGLPVVIVHPTNPLGPRDIKPTPTGALILSVLKGKLPGYVDGGLNFVDVDDVAVGHMAAMEKGRPGEKYILGNSNLSIKQYFDLIAEIGGGRAPALKIPLPMAVATAYVYEAIARITNKPPITSVSWVKIGSHYSFWDSSRAIRELGLPQTPIRSSIRREITWFRERGYV